LCTYTCEWCKQTKTEPKQNTPRFCSQSCRNCWQHSVGHRKVGFDPHISTYSYWVKKYGVEGANEKDQEYRKTMSETILSADMSHQKEVARKLRIAYNHSCQGKTLEEIHGIEKAKMIREKISIKTRGSNNPAYGKVYMNGGKSVKGWYKGIFFRSLLEYSFMKFLEQKGISLKNDLECECFQVPYVFNNHERTYRIDFYVKSEKTVYEIKQFYALQQSSNIIKWQAANAYFEQRGLNFRVVTERDFLKIPFDVAYQDVDVIWNKKSFMYFKSYEKFHTN